MALPDVRVAGPVRVMTTPGLWTRLRCAWSACRYMQERPGPPAPGDLDRLCPLCGSPFAAVTVFRLDAGPAVP